MKLSPEELTQLLQLKTEAEKSTLINEINNLRYQNQYLTYLVKYQATLQHVINPMTGEITLNQKEEIKNDG